MQPTSLKKHFLIDSCVAEYLLDKEMQPSINSQLALWAGDAFDLAVSDITFAELIDRAYKEKIDRVKQSLDAYTQIEVSQRIMIGSGILSNVYRRKFQKTNGASLQDKILASTAFVYNFPIITADVHDFPHPFFTTVTSETLEYTKKGKKRFITLDILKPNATELNYWYSKVQ